MSDAKEWRCPREPNHDVEVTRWGWPQCAVCRAAPPYHERPSYLDPNTTLLLYVPASGPARSIIAPGAGIVGFTKSGLDVVAYEGWTNGAMQYEGRDARGLWEAGVFHASGRMVTGYPTIAQGAFPQGDLMSVGVYNPTTNEIVVLDEEHLNEWLGVS